MLCTCNILWNLFDYTYIVVYMVNLSFRLISNWVLMNLSTGNLKSKRQVWKFIINWNIFKDNTWGNSYLIYWVGWKWERNGVQNIFLNKKKDTLKLSIISNKVYKLVVWESYKLAFFSFERTVENLYLIFT